MCSASEVSFSSSMFLFSIKVGATPFTPSLAIAYRYHLSSAKILVAGPVLRTISISICGEEEGGEG